MEETRCSQIQTPIVVRSGAMVWLELHWSESAISSIKFTSTQNSLANDPLPTKWLEVFERYWDKPLDSLTRSKLSSLSLDLAGTDYQQKVWSELQMIPTGQTASYGLISDRLKSSARAVASACRENPVVLAVPCHRVISKSGVGGFMGAMTGDPIDIKIWLLNHEQ